MKVYLNIFILILFFTLQIFSQNNPQKIAGVYQWCPFPCETFKINSDFTFDYLINGDLFNNERTRGTWKFVGDNKIYLKSPERKLISKVTEKQKEDNGKILIQVTDFTGAILPGIIIKTLSLGVEKLYVTNDEGTCEIPKTDEIEIKWERFSEKYKIKNLETNYLFFEIPAYNEPFIDRTFLLKNEQLFQLNDTNSITNGYQRLNKKKSLKLFSTKKN